MTVKVQTPCLITCIKELNEPRYMSVGGVYESFKKPIAVFDFNTLKDDPLIDLTTIGLKGSPPTYSSPSLLLRRVLARCLKAPTRLPARALPKRLPPSTLSKEKGEHKWLTTAWI